MVIEMNNENGSVIMTVLLIMAMILFVALSTAKTTTTEMGMVRNKIFYKQNLYMAEAAIKEAARRVELAPDDVLIDRTLKGMMVDVDMLDPANWPGASAVAFDFNDDDITDLNIVNWRGERDTIRYAVVDRGIASGSSLSMAGPGTQVHLYDILGRYDSVSHGQSMVQIQYRKRF
jgi:hypothetical protein